MSVKVDTIIQCPACGEEWADANYGYASNYDKLEARCKELEKELSEAKRDAFNWQCRAIDTKCSLVDAEQTIERAEKSTDAVLILRKYLERKKNA